MSSDNKYVNMGLRSATRIGLDTGIRWGIKKVAKENFITDPSSSLMSYLRWVLTDFLGSLAMDYLETQKILPSNV